MIFLYRLLKHLGILFLVSFPLQLIGMILLAIYLPLERLLLKPTEDVKLPACLKWFDCADLYPEVNRDPVYYYTNVLPQGLLYRYYWLAIRNPCNYFGYQILGFKIKTSIRYIKSNQNLIDYAYHPIGDTKSAGYFTIEYLIDEVVRYEYYWIYKYSATMCFRFRMGYKLGLPSELNIGDNIQQVMVISPYHSYSGS